jgi:hypothetical protein
VATPTQKRRRSQFGLILGLIFAMVAWSAIAYASEVDIAVVDVTVPTSSVTLAPGGSASITINMSVTGNQAGTATFEVYRNWTLSGGTFTGSNPQEFTVGPRGGGDPATTFSTTGTVSVAAGHAAGTFTLAVGAFDITNSNTTGAKLATSHPSNYQVTVSAPADTTAPSISYVLNPASPDGNNGWYKSDVTLTWTVSEPQSPASLVKTGCVDQSVTADQAETTYSCSATSAGGSAGPVEVKIKRDATEPTISGSASPGANANGWNNTDVAVSFTCDDNLSGVASCGPNQTLSSEGAGQSASGSAVDNAGNSANTTVSGINIDKTAPTVALVGGPADGASYYFGFVPAAPTCSASDDLSGLDGSCSLSGYGTTVGPHTVKATAMDKAGNTASDEKSYTVLAWTTNGFFQPVDMGGVWNTAKNGSTVPLKFEVFAGSTELSDTAIVNQPLKATQTSCSGGTTDDIELLATGNTSLRYDATAGQFIYNWQTPKKAGYCYVVTVTLADGSSITANFRLK